MDKLFLSMKGERKGGHVKVVSEMHGHSSIAITLAIYFHVLPDMQEAAVDVMDDILS